MEAANSIQSDLQPPRDSIFAWKALDVFVAVNVLIDLLVWWLVNFDRYVQQPDLKITPALFGCLLGLLAGLGTVWWWLRRQPLPIGLIGVAQVALLLHFAGALIHIEGERLNAVVFLGVRFNKLAVFTCTYAVAWLLAEVAGSRDAARSPVLRVLIALAALGVGAGLEIFQYLVLLAAVPPDIARFQESLRDLLAELGGAAAWLLVASASTVRIHVQARRAKA